MNNEGYYQKVANRTRIDMDGRSPRLRLSLIGYCIEQGIVPDVETIEALTAFVAQDIDAFCDMILALPTVEEEENTKPSPERNGYDMLGGQYM